MGVGVDLCRGGLMDGWMLTDGSEACKALLGVRMPQRTHIPGGLSAAHRPGVPSLAVSPAWRCPLPVTESLIHGGHRGQMRK